MTNPVTPNIPPYPWQQSLWDLLAADLQAQRLSHALLFHGQAGMGKFDFAHCFAKALLCNNPVSNNQSSNKQLPNTQPQSAPCGNCKGCLLFESQTHPDFVLVEPEELGKAIRIDQIRALAEFLGQTAQQGGRRCIVVHPADALNINAANALLKSLEEPPAGTIFLLVTASLFQISPTIRSRCRLLAFSNPAPEQALTWLLANGVAINKAEQLLTTGSMTPLRILQVETDGVLAQQERLAKQLVAFSENHTSVVDVAKDWAGMETSFLLNTMLAWLNHSLRAGFDSSATQQNGDGVVHSKSENHLFELLAKLQPTAVVGLYDSALAVKRLLLGNANLNKNLVWEDFLLDWLKFIHPSRNRQGNAGQVHRL